jgi:predicted nicotinamide N-methyase
MTCYGCAEQCAFVFWLIHQFDVWEKQGDREDSGFQIWPTSILLSRMFLSDSFARFLNGKSVVELGAGVGIPGLALSSRGIQTVITDHRADIVRLVESNIHLNGIGCARADIIDWEIPVSAEFQHSFDFVFACDVLYDQSKMGAFIGCLDSLVRANGRILVITAKEREGVYAFAPLLQQVRKQYNSSAITPSQKRN